MTGPRRSWRRWTASTLVLLAIAAVAAAAAPSLWTRLEKDGIHDPKSPAIALLQQPGEALEALPRDTAGNLVNWVQAIDSGAIDPRTNILPGTEVRLRVDDIIVAKYGSMPAVKFPHRQHTLWLGLCQLPRPDLQAADRGQQAQHGGHPQRRTVAGFAMAPSSFPLTECNRCHSVPNASLRRRAGP